MYVTAAAFGNCIFILFRISGHSSSYSKFRKSSCDSDSEIKEQKKTNNNNNNSSRIKNNDSLVASYIAPKMKQIFKIHVAFILSSVTPMHCAWSQNCFFLSLFSFIIVQFIKRYGIGWNEDWKLLAFIIFGFFFFLLSLICMKHSSNASVWHFNKYEIWNMNNHWI